MSEKEFNWPWDEISFIEHRNAGKPSKDWERGDDARHRVLLWITEQCPEHPEEWEDHGCLCQECLALAN